MPAIPIWKDKLVTLGTNVTSVEFAIRRQADYAIVYTGKAFAKPGETSVQIRINDICADYLTRAFPLEAADYYGGKFTIDIKTYYEGGSYAWQSVELDDFVRDWSYDTGMIHGTDIPMVPVQPMLNPLQYLPIWAYGGTYSYTLIYNDPDGDFNMDFGYDFFIGSERRVNVSVSDYAGGDFFFLDLRTVPGVVAVEANGITYKVADLCGGYVLYYLNAYGSWDALPVQGRTVKSAGIKRYNREAIYNNQQYYARGTDNYVNEISPEFALNIGPLTTAQSERMHHLLGSTFVYLHDIEKNRIHPVVLTASSMDHKDQRGVLHFYEVRAKLAQERIRR